jgi:tocopherol cyclase
MWNRLRNIWRPESFHYHHRLERGGGQFEGWYLKLVDAAGEQPYALIPGVFLGADRHAFLQVLDGRAGTAAYHRFPLECFEAARDRFEVSIAGNRFGPSGVSLDVARSSAGQAVRGEVRFGPWRPWPVTALSPGSMGPYSFVPFMECNHGILSLDHPLEGALEVDGRRTGFDGGRGYVEKDWGRAFPSGYVWTQSNHFEQTGVSLTAAVAVIPWLTGAFRGHIVGFLHGGVLHRFTTYTKSVLEHVQMSESHLHLVVRSRTHRLEIAAKKAAGAILHAPYEKQMIERVAETMMSEVDVRLSRLDGGGMVFAGRGRNACLEAQGDLGRVLDA